MRFVVCLFIFIAVVSMGMSRDLSRAFIKSSDTAQVASATQPSHQMPPPPAQQNMAYSRTVRLDGDRHGQFRVEARVDGRAIDFMVDTGASSVVLRESSAAKLGIFPRPSEYTGRTSTANGITKFAPVRLSRIEVNGISVYDVNAAVLPDESLGVNLLGMTFLSRIKFSHDHGRLVLEQ